ncbi:MAG: hypothetical protein II707_06400 [Spirochaetales bacterium]|jgi:hypothetical protein|nr:hypothetical protein [Spirochaetales bacterium]
MSEKDIFTQDELNNLAVNETISVQQEVQNLAILAKNELGIIEKDAMDYSDKDAKRIKKRLDTLLLKIVTLRKSTEK